MLDIALIVGSVRTNRFADKAAEWVRQGAAERTDFRLTTLDLRDFPLPFFDDAMSPAYSPTTANPEGQKWRDTVARFDGYIMTVAEYNRGPTAVLKNALDWAYAEWNRKPVGFVGYGPLGAARAVEQLRLNAVELQMVPTRTAVHIAMDAFMGAYMQGKTLDSYEFLNQPRTAVFDEVVWWGEATKAARAVPAKAAA
jgi:NAD(P)H-dependent FMN reductase